MERGSNFKPNENGKLGQEQRIYVNADEFIKRLEVGIDKTSLITAQHAQVWIRKYAEWYPDELCSVVNKLVKKGKEYESIKHVDGAESSRMVKETVIGLGKEALEYLDENDEYSKNLAGRIRGEIRKQKIKEIFKNLLPRKK
jgi:hypothetical protein